MSSKSWKVAKSFSLQVEQLHVRTPTPLPKKAVTLMKTRIFKNKLNQIKSFAILAVLRRSMCRPGAAGAFWGRAPPNHYLCSPNENCVAPR